ncbi:MULTISPECIES: type II toxin-antitoxin system VapC family toxin [unclassified Burkholderia]|uniref:type II toxin-antitoxin system VapC family toxin n=1 Tax=unclassified Burkholderia TaxID=2613784 RepID=UPI00214FE411|nr:MULTISPECIES: type II toxin-antitoxin system VapC family toxin [unclassified Burkholderia]MCR4470521.1 type II toxin-antitoxin system VapC family toxin [Burkholderia sp. SCN-KJ]
MKVLLDTHLLLWAAADAAELPSSARSIIQDPAYTLLFSVVSLWEIVIKRGLDRDDFQVDPHLLRRNLLDVGYVELPITSAHVLCVEQLPAVHRDPFDRLLIAQAISEGVSLLTHDHTVARYAGPIQHV